jgi:hypothetical protein
MSPKRIEICGVSIYITPTIPTISSIILVYPARRFVPEMVRHDLLELVLFMS